MIENACFALAILSVLLVPLSFLFCCIKPAIKAVKSHIAEAPLRAAYAARRGTPVKTKKILKTIGLAIGYCIGGIVLVLFAMLLRQTFDRRTYNK